LVYGFHVLLYTLISLSKGAEETKYIVAKANNIKGFLLTLIFIDVVYVRHGAIYVKFFLHARQSINISETAVYSVGLNSRFNIVIKGTASLSKEVTVLREFVLKQPGEQWCVVVVDFEFAIASLCSFPSDDFEDAFGSVVLKPQIDCPDCNVLECLI